MFYGVKSGENPILLGVNSIDIMGELPGYFRKTAGFASFCCPKNRLQHMKIFCAATWGTIIFEVNWVNLPEKTWGKLKKPANAR